MDTESDVENPATHSSIRELPYSLTHEVRRYIALNNKCLNLMPECRVTPQKYYTPFRYSLAKIRRLNIQPSFDFLRTDEL